MERAKQLLLAVILLGFVSAFFWPMEFPVDGQFWRTVMDSAHLPLFALITFICYGFVSDRNLSHERKCKYAFIAAAIISIAIELTQPLVGRTRSDLDQIYGIGGALCGAALLFLWPRRGEKQVLGSMILLLLVFVFATSAPAMKKYSILNWRSEQFPMLGSFEDSTDYLLWRPNYYAYTTMPANRIGAAMRPSRSTSTIRLIRLCCACASMMTAIVPHTANDSIWSWIWIPDGTM
jgi:hypothetical protein